MGRPHAHLWEHAACLLLAALCDGHLHRNSHVLDLAQEPHGVRGVGG
jgi:hypothetical protein